MKRFIALCAVSFFITYGFAQQNNKDLRYKQLSGRYGSTTEGIYLFDDGKFLLYGYATAIFGNYGFEKDYLLFSPDKPKLFEVYAYQNKSMANGTRVNFSGFDRGGKTFVQFEGESIKRVFNKDANCFDGPFVYEAKKKPKNMVLSILEEAQWSGEKINYSWLYNNDKGYNDFILIYNKPTHYYENFKGMISALKDKTVLKLAGYLGNKDFLKQQSNEDQQQWLEVLEWKKQYYISKDRVEDVLFVNKHYNSFTPPDSLNYVYNEASNEYISKHAAENEEYYRQNQYNADHYLRKYVKLEPVTKGNARFSENDVSTSSIFYTVCGEGSEKSYHYNGYQKYPEELKKEK
ncbi:preprotein translocase subunit SecD [Pedobacter punctiformis]|uniref:Preprotein translocase subunit SecD n=1 Tax=Pedobacter punctiformis TaxID=3004097 RepID=A0ABT4LAS9_9SPHI|nr:preprotein translocase subunit SecD [Pedobacter sp. HCMS5-2]MCZ4244263.1 preprotein translocase subunit SecD [Pedobacter sp. HCMS5-2]